jgi:hypothetical protein
MTTADTGAPAETPEPFVLYEHVARRQATEKVGASAGLPAVATRLDEAWYARAETARRLAPYMLTPADLLDLRDARNWDDDALGSSPIDSLGPAQALSTLLTGFRLVSGPGRAVSIATDPHGAYRLRCKYLSMDSPCMLPERWETTPRQFRTGTL